MTNDEMAARIRRLELLLGTLITWIARGASAPISVKEAQQLLADLQEEVGE